jgi:hypothetical protein
MRAIAGRVTGKITRMSAGGITGRVVKSVAGRITINVPAIFTDVAAQLLALFGREAARAVRVSTIRAAGFVRHAIRFLPERRLLAAPSLVTVDRLGA